jgi:hypothetical protein
MTLGRWFGQIFLVLLVNWMCHLYSLSCVGDALLDIIQLCKLKHLIQLLLLLVFWFLIKDLENDKTRNLSLALYDIGVVLCLRCMTIWSCAQQPNLELTNCWWNLPCLQASDASLRPLTLLWDDLLAYLSRGCELIFVLTMLCVWGAYPIGYVPSTTWPCACSLFC